MSTEKDTTMTNTFERFAWAPNEKSAAEWAGIGAGYQTKDTAIRQRGMDSDGKGGKLYRITVEEVEVPEPTWWAVEDRDGDIIADSIRIRDGLRPYAMAEMVNGACRKWARVKALDRDSAITAAQDAWRELAAKIGGAK